MFYFVFCCSAQSCTTNCAVISECVWPLLYLVLDRSKEEILDNVIRTSLLSPNTNYILKSFIEFRSSWNFEGNFSFQLKPQLSFKLRSRWRILLRFGWQKTQENRTCLDSLGNRINPMDIQGTKGNTRLVTVVSILPKVKFC